MPGAGLRVAIQGERGAFSHQAALQVCGEGITLVPRPTFDALVASVLDGEADRGILPIENSLVGSIHENYDRLRHVALSIVGETQVRVDHCLIGRPGATLQSIRRVASHPVALAQCTRFFAERPDLEPVPAYDTAGSVLDLLRKDGPVTSAAIASRLAAEIHGGAILLEKIQDDPENHTRFVVLSKVATFPTGPSKTSVVFALKNAPGALHRALTPFASRGVDLAKIESRPLKGRPWEYVFYIDVLGAPGAGVDAALEELRALSEEFRVLGHYPPGTTMLTEGG